MTDTARLTTALAGRYTVLRELGAGGMATVYLAEDARHHRQVALKVLRPELAAVIGAERFLKEIETTANLQHPHILPLFDSGTVDGTVFYVMPYVEGESLRDRIQRERQLPVEEAVRITREVASALDYAHRKGIVHRDIKPENILLHDGQALVADFGIALAASTTGGTRMTETGMSLGTPHYMSPEQAMGERTLDARTDVYALGCVLYEMLTGEPPFNGPTAQAIVARVMTDRPRPVTETRPTVPEHVEAAVTTALQKLPADRFATAAEFSAALASAGYTTPGRAVAAAVGARAQRLPWLVAGLALLVAAAAGVAALQRPSPVDLPVVRSVIRLPDGAFLSDHFVALSRDGSRLVVRATDQGTRRLMVRRLDAMEFAPIVGSEEAGFPFLSADGRWVAFRTRGEEKKTLLDGGSAITIGQGSWNGTWTEDGTLYFPQSYNSGLFRMSAEGGAVETLSTPDSTRQELGHWHPQLLPGGRHLMFTAFTTPIEKARIEVLDLETRERTVLVEGAVHGQYLPTGHLLFVRGTTVFAVPMSPSSLRTTGTPVPVLENVAHEDTDGHSGLAVSDNGTLVYVQATHFEAPSQLMWHDRAGRTTPVAGAPANAQQPSLSPDGSRVAYTINEGGWDVWVLDLARGSRTRLTTGGGADFAPIWTRDGGSVVFTSERPVFDIYQRVADASSPAQIVSRSPNDKFPSDAIPGGDELALVQSLQTGSAIHRRGQDSTASPVLVLSGVANFQQPRFSPDGRWMAYVSDESGRFEVYVVPYPDVAARRLQVSTDGGLDPAWTKLGTEIVFRGGPSIMAVSFDPVRGQLGTPLALFQHNRVSSIAGDVLHSFAVTPDGERFIMAVRPPGTDPREIVVVTNWFKELREKMAGGRE